MTDPEVHEPYRRIAEVVRELHARPEKDADTVLAELAEHAAAEIPGTQYAGITVRTGRHQIDTPAATHPFPILLDAIQQRHQEGPCLTSAWAKKTIYVRDLRTDDRWPNYQREALAETPIRSIMAFELYLADESMGALNIYAEQPEAFTGDSEQVGEIFAMHSVVAWNSARRDEQFRNALATRDVIGQAKGMVMERYGIDAIQAFDMLRKLSQDGNVALTTIARELVEQSRPTAS